ncbi:hypothetical protein HPB49_007489 [Dermacentor silvarum]|uniref:Uncharacterized protein n=1 Tax=Dermacentor silvarum TaxID=543639 RepID=A0ACB8DJ47_DERSI|nr:hypothetical protein HPB49_007489 [Dermacentor silvarum]
MPVYRHCRRGSASDWYEVLCVHLRHSRNVRLWFANQVLFAHPHRLAEYLLECPTTETGCAVRCFTPMEDSVSHGSTLVEGIELRKTTFGNMPA